MFPAVESGATSLILKESLKKRLLAIFGPLATLKHGPGGVVRLYYGCLSFKYLILWQHCINFYEEHFMSLAKDMFNKRSNKLLEMFMDRKGMEQAVDIEWGTFCAIQFLNSARYVPGDGAAIFEQV